MKFLVYSDIHYDHLGASCVTLQDCEAVERTIFKRAGEGFSFTLFCGDRFLRREPLDEVKTVADAVYYDGLPCPHMHLVGNHDWTKNSMQWHTSKSLLRTPIVLMDEPKTYAVPGQPCLIHALPAGYRFDFSKYNPDPSFYNIFVFHDLVAGSWLDPKGKNQAAAGISLEEIDRPEFDAIFGGDNHVPQMFDLKNTWGGYVGSVVQRNMGDANLQRGWLELGVHSDKTHTLDFVPTRNFFSRAAFEVDEHILYENLRIPEELVTDQYVRIELSGKKKDVDRLVNDPRWENYRTFYNARGLEIVRHYVAEKSEVVLEMKLAATLLDDLNVYVDSGFAELGTVSREKVAQVVATLQKEV